MEDSGELECIAGMTQVLHCCNSDHREGGRLSGGGKRLLQQTVARKHLWHLLPLMENAKPD